MFNAKEFSIAQRLTWMNLLVSGVAGDLPSVGSGSLGAAVLTVVYVLVWFYGIRALAGTSSGRK